MLNPGNLDGDVQRVTGASGDIANYAKPYPVDQSPENPLLNLSPQEFLALK